MSSRSDYESFSPMLNGAEEDAAETTVPLIPGDLRELNKRRRSSFTLPSSGEELCHVKRKWKEDSWQVKALAVLNSDPVQIFLVLLLLLDVLILFTELAIDAHFPSCMLVTRDAVSCCPDGPHVDNIVLPTLGGDDSHGHSLCKNPLVETDYPSGCDDHKHDGAHVAHEVLFWITVTILATFEIELLIMIYLLGPGNFFRQLLYAFDFFIVTISLILELSFRLSESIQELWGVLIIFRLWRFVRIGHGLVASTYEIQEHKMHLAMEHLEQLEELLKKRGDQVPERPEQLGKSH